MLRGKKILLGITGSIAAYKTAHLVRLLKKAGAQVQVIMSPASLDFITPLTLSTLSENPVYSTFFEEDEKLGMWTNHVDLALWADYMLIAPASANTLGKMAQGICDNLLMACYLSAKCPVLVAPAMDLDMYKHGSTKDNMATLVNRGNVIIPAESGLLASGLEGEGRMAEPENIQSYLEQFIQAKLPLNGKKALVTAGPTYEPIDPVRFIGNHSSGKMGIALAEALAQAGAQVTLVCGPSAVPSSDAVHRINVQTAVEMEAACQVCFAEQDLVIGAAAVADYRPAEVAEQKIKKKGEEMSIHLVKNPDILKGIGAQKQNQILVGFALETENEEAHAEGKLKAKNLDLILLNSLNHEGAGFGGDTNVIQAIGPNNKKHSFGLNTKTKLAQEIIRFIVEKFFHE